MLAITRVTNPAILVDPGFREFLTEAFKGSLFSRSNPLEAFPALVDMMAAPNCGLFVAVEDGTYKGVAIVMLPAGPLDAVPRVTLFFCKRGAKGLKTGLIAAVVDFVKQGGYSVLWAMNGSGARDSVWKRVFRNAGKAKRIGSVMEIDLKDGQHGRTIREASGEHQQAG